MTSVAPPPFKIFQNWYKFLKFWVKISKATNFHQILRWCGCKFIFFMICHRMHLLATVSSYIKKNLAGPFHLRSFHSCLLFLFILTSSYPLQLSFLQVIILILSTDSYNKKYCIQYLLQWAQKFTISVILITRKFLDLYLQCHC